MRLYWSRTSVQGGVQIGNLYTPCTYVQSVHPPVQMGDTGKKFQNFFKKNCAKSGPNWSELVGFGKKVSFEKK